MSKAQAPVTALPRTRRAFEPARYSQQYLACAYLQLVPRPCRRVSAPPTPLPAAPPAPASAAS